MSAPEPQRLEDFIIEPQIRKHLENGGYVIVRIGDVQFWVNQGLVDALLEQPPRENRTFPEAKNTYISENTATRICEALDGPRFNVQYNQFLSIKKKYESMDEEQANPMAESDLYALHSILEASYKEIFERQINDDPYPTDMCIEICTFMAQFPNADVHIEDIKSTDDEMYCETDGINWRINIPTKGSRVAIDVSKRQEFDLRMKVVLSLEAFVQELQKLQGITAFTSTMVAQFDKHIEWIGRYFALALDQKKHFPQLNQSQYTEINDRITTAHDDMWIVYKKFYPSTAE